MKTRATTTGSIAAILTCNLFFIYITLQNQICNGIDQLVFEWKAREYDVFPEIYIEKEQIVGAKKMTKQRRNHLLDKLLG
jgi:hypothetical protein